MKGIKEYTVVLLFNADGSKVLLVKKDRTTFAGKLNGVGGKIEEGETPEQCAYREIQEESSLPPEKITDLTWIGTLVIPEQCDTDNEDKCPKLWFYTGIVASESWAHTPENETEPVAWYMLNKDSVPFTDLELAGNGSLEYFIKMARRILFKDEAASYE